MDKLIGNLKVHKIIMEKDDEISKVKKEKVKSLALKAKHSKSSSEEDNEQSNSDNGEEYAMAIKEFKIFFRRKGKFVRQQKKDKRSFNKKSSYDEKKDKSKDERRCFRCGDLNHFIQDCLKPLSKDNNNNSFISGVWSDSGDENDEVKEDKCLMTLGTNEVHFNSTYYSDELIDNYVNLKMQYDGLCDLSSKDEMKSFQHHKQTLSTFNKSSEILDDLLKAQKPSNGKSGLGFSNDTDVASTSKTKSTTFVKAKNLEVDRNILLKAKAKVAQTSKVSIEKPQVVKRFYKPKQEPGYVKDKHPRQVSRYVLKATYKTMNGL
ncbi:hypothetical protein L1987_58354 [Smallanthus sonchifolius]|uniref:Uncharacterized protein n=1 Tax=Smallanthus sonchifolius TaxID=185202 RepID=A0ACB9DFE8_9ASTR|nr:hypothetical protein L1987_58354 [Smallanthus sonchifolius]